MEMQTTDQLLRLPEVIELTGLSRSFIYKLIGQGRFPSQVRIGLRATAWRKSELQVWIAKLNSPQ